ncbi:MAG: arginine--tRNA ligase [Candidatus Falkowbacteria bacterium]|nr:arginine--tRNA ligase [Candidatus Falkowbacteria bacterium]
MYALDRIKHELASELGHLLKANIKAVDFVAPPQEDLGDLSLPCFVLAKELKQNPTEVAKDIAKNFKHKFIKDCSAAGPYLNISLSDVAFNIILANLVKFDANFGFNKNGAAKRVMIEYANQNTHKELHVGHLRNLAYGNAINRILTANGYKVIPVSYINDFGINVAKTIWWLYHKENIEARKILAMGPENKGYFLGQQYAQSVEQIEKNPEQKGEVAEVMKQLESRRGEIYKLWKKTRQWNINQFALAYKELDIKFKTIFYESDFIKEGLKMVNDLKNKKFLIDSEGAVIADLEQYKLGVLVVLRSDGTALYPVADLALAVEKIKRYKLDESLYIVDMRQELYFDQLFKLLELLGYATKFEHLSYDYVKLPSGMISSRSGNIIPYEDLKDMALEKAKAEIAKRHETWTKKQINETARVIAFGALKFEMVKVGSLKQITFDIDTALRFDGFTAAYLQYTYARIQSINHKADKKLKQTKVDWSKLIDKKEKVLIMHLSNFPDTIVLAGDKKDPAEIAKYLFDLAQKTNDYYHAVSVLKADTVTGAARLALLNSVASIIKQGLKLLGIETINEM